MTKYQYKKIKVLQHDIEPELNKYGESGWKVIYVEPDFSKFADGGDFYIIFLEKSKEHRYSPQTFAYMGHPSER